MNSISFDRVNKIHLYNPRMNFCAVNSGCTVENYTAITRCKNVHDNCKDVAINRPRVHSRTSYCSTFEYKKAITSCTFQPIRSIFKCWRQHDLLLGVSVCLMRMRRVSARQKKTQSKKIMCCRSLSFS